MTNINYIKGILNFALFVILWYLPFNDGIAQIKHPLELDYAGTVLKGSVAVSIKILEKDQASKTKPILFSSHKIKANASNFINPVLVVEFSNLDFQAPADLNNKLSLNIVPPPIPKGFKQRTTLVAIEMSGKEKDMTRGYLKINEKKSFTYEIEPSDTILAGTLDYQLTAVGIGKRSFKIENNTLSLALNITPPPLFPDDVSENELWAIASKLNTLKAYKMYVEKFPQGKSVNRAKMMQRELMNHPVTEVPNNQTSSNPDIQINEKREWERVKSANSIVAYNNYLKSFPEGQYAGEAEMAVKLLVKPVDSLVVKSTEEELIGRLIYQIEDTMTVGQTYRVRMEISADTSTHFFEKLISKVEAFSDHPEDLNTEIIQIGKTMHAHLEESNPEGERNFYIHLFGESSEREVNLYSSKSTIWEWDVTPLKAGYHPLYFTIEIITIKDGLATPEVLPVYDSKITILSRSIFQAYKIQLISGGIITALLVIILLLFFKKKKANANQKDIEKLIKNKPLEGAIALIEEDKIKEALDLLDQLLKNKDAEIFQEVILLKSRLSGNEEKLKKAVISNEVAATELNNIKFSALDIIERSKGLV